MRKMSVVVLGLILLALVSTALRAQEAAKKQAMPTMAMPAADGEKLGSYIMKENLYTNWKLFPGTTKMYKGGEPHGSLLTTYVNEVALDSITKKKEFAEGSIIVKENYTPDKKLVALTTMYKVKGFNPQVGDWFWLSTAPDGKVQASGKIDACIQCHIKAKMDYVFTKIPK